MTADLCGFKIYLRYELNRSAHTVDSYMSDISAFIGFLSVEPEQFHPQDVTMQDIRAWIGGMAAQGMKPASLRRKVQSLRALFRFLIKRKVLTKDPTADIQLTKLPRQLPKFVREEEMESLLAEMAANSDGSFPSVRDSLIIEFLYTTGLRQAELLGISDADINPLRAQIRIMGKRSKERILPLPPPLIDKITEYQKIRNDFFHLPPGNHNFFLTNRGMPMNKTALYRIINIKLSSTSSEKRSPHVLRHTFASSMLNNGAGFMEVKEFLGHASLNSTQIYTHVSLSELKKSYNQAHPRAIKNEDHGSDD